MRELQSNKLHHLVIKLLRTEYKSLLKRSLTPKKVTFPNDFETEVSCHTPKRDKEVNHGIKKTHKAYNDGFLQLIHTPPKANHGVISFKKPVKIEDMILENKINSCFGLSIENQYQTHLKEPD